MRLGRTEGRRAGASRDDRRGDEARSARVERDALRVAVAAPTTAAAYFDELLFAEERYARTFAAVATHSSIHDAMDRAEPEVANLIAELSQEETDATAEQAFVRLVQEAAGRAKERLNQVARNHDVSAEWLARSRDFGQLLDVLARDDVGTDLQLETAMELLAWLLEEAVVEGTPTDE